MPKINKTIKTGVCQICHKEKRLDELIPGALIRRSVFEEISREHPQFDPEEYICLKDLEVFRYEQVRKLLEVEKGELSDLDKEILTAIRDHEMLTEAVSEIEDDRTFGDRLSDRIAAFGGSWTFIITFFSFILIWMIINIWILSTRAFDPFPFILLNLILSCLAAIQAPIIMMSQNRQEQKDRQRGEHDYKINLKAELEIKLLSEKIDHLLVHQNKKLLEIQEVQTDYLEDLMKEIKKK